MFLERSIVLQRPASVHTWAREDDLVDY